MDILNGTLQPITLKYDGQIYHFPKSEIVDVPDDAGQFLLSKHKRTGIIRVRYSDNEDKAKLASMETKLAWYKAAVAKFERANALQAEKKFPALEMDPATRIAVASIPAYEKVVEVLKKKCGDRVGHEIADELESSLEEFDDEKPIEMPQLEGQSLSVMRDMCRERGIDFNMRWPRSRYVSAINKHDEESKAS